MLNRHPVKGRPHCKLSVNAQRIRQNRAVGWDWYTGFFARWKGVISERASQPLAALRAQCTSRASSLRHFEQLEETLKWAGIIGVLTKPECLLNTDECPNMINGLRRGFGGKLIGGAGCAANKIVGEEHAENVGQDV